MTAPRPPSSAQMYLSGSMGVLFSRGIGMVAGVVSLWLLTRLLTTEAFAGYMLAMSLAYVLGFASGFGFERVLLLRISALPVEPGVLQGGRLARRIAVRVGFLSAGAALAAVLVLHWVPALSARNDLASWFVLVAPIVPSVALATVLVAWLQANHTVGRPQALFGQMDGLRCAGFALVFVLGIGSWAVAAAAVLAAILVPLVLAWRQIGRSQPEPSAFSTRDIRDGFRFFLQRLAMIGFQHADILVLGIYASPQVVASYVVASRFAMILEAGQQVFAPAYAPRVRHHMKAGTPELAAREYHVARVLGFLAAGTAGLGFLGIGQPLLSLFGANDEAFGILLILCAGQVMLVGAGLHGVHMSMTDHLTKAMLIQVVSFGLFVTLLFLWVPGSGARGAALAFLVAQAVFAGLGLTVLALSCGIWPKPRTSMVTYGVAVGALALAGIAPEQRVLCGLVLMAALAGTALRDVSLLRGILGESLAGVFRRR